MLTHCGALKSFCICGKRSFFILGIVHYIRYHRLHIHNNIYAPAIFEPICKTRIIVCRTRPNYSSVPHFLGNMFFSLIAFHHKLINLFIGFNKYLIDSAGEMEVKKSVQPKCGTGHLRIIGFVDIPFLQLIFKLFVVYLHSGKICVPVKLFACLFLDKSDARFNLVNGIFLYFFFGVSKRNINNMRRKIKTPVDI